MTLVSNDPSWWPTISSNIYSSYFLVASSAVVIYDWVLSFGHEVELVWRQRWSLMTVLYLSVRYMGIIYAGVNMLNGLPSLSVTDVGCNDILYTINWMNVVTTAMLGVIMVVRLHAMYQRSRKMLTFLVVIFLTINISCVVINGLDMMHVSGEALILSGTYQCAYRGGSLEDQTLRATLWVLTTVWEILALCLAVRVTVKHIRELQRCRGLTGRTVSDCFMVLIQAHVVYFASFVGSSCMNLTTLSPSIVTSSSRGIMTYEVTLSIVMVLQLFVLGPRLILGVREYHAKLVSDSDAGDCMTSIAFQERVHVSTGSGV